MTELDLSDPGAVQDAAGELAGGIARGDLDNTDAPTAALTSIALSLHAAGLRAQADAAHLAEFDSFVDVRPYPQLAPFDPVIAPLGCVVARPDPSDLRRWVKADDDHLSNTIVWLLVYPGKHPDAVALWINTDELPSDVVMLGPAS